MRASTGVATIGAALAVVSGVEILTHGPLTRLDRRVADYYFGPIYQDWITHKNTTTPLMDFGRFLSDIGKPSLACLVVGVLAVVASLIKRQAEPALAAAIGLGVVGISTLVLKHVFPHKSILGHLPGSFPSGHTGVAVVTSGLIVFMILPRRPWRDGAVLAVAALWGGVMAWGRLIVEAHWLSDVIAGWGIGMCALVLALRTADLPPSIRGWGRSTPADK